jgi:DNA-directed RNA polymerase subunit K/omega
MENYMLNKITKSRGPDLDTNKCVKMVGGSKFDLILIAAARARELAQIHRAGDDVASLHAPVTALLDVQKGLVGREYLLKVRK